MADKEMETYTFWGTAMESLVGAWKPLVVASVDDDKAFPVVHGILNGEHNQFKQFKFAFLADWCAPPNGDLTIDGLTVKMGFRRLKELKRFWRTFYGDLVKAFVAVDLGVYKWYASVSTSVGAGEIRAMMCICKREPPEKVTTFN